MVAAGFLPVEVKLSDAPPRFVVRGEDVAAVAFLAPASPAETRMQRGWAALAELSGRAPPLSFAEPGDLVAQLERRQHVGALACLAPSLYLDESGEPAQVRFSQLSPLLGAGFLGDDHNVASPIDRLRHEVERSEGAVRIVCWQRFGLGSPIHPRGRYHDESPRPLGFIRVTCDLDREGHTSTHLACSYLPTVWFYRDGLRVFRAEASERTPGEIEAVLRASPEVATGTTHRRLDAASYVQPIV